MKNFLQMRYEFISRFGIGFAKYLFAFCMLIGMQVESFAQVNVSADKKGTLCDGNNQALNVKSNGSIVRASNGSYVFQVDYGADVQLSVPAVLFPAPVYSVKWEKKTSKNGDWQEVATQDSDEPLTLTNVQHDVLYRGSYDAGLGKQEYKALILQLKSMQILLILVLKMLLSLQC